MNRRELLHALAIGGLLAASPLRGQSPPCVAAAAAPTFSPTPGTYYSAQQVTLTSVGAAIYYTLDGSPPSTSSTPYTGPITVGTTETIKAIAVASGLSESAVATGAYVISLPLSFQIVGGQTITNPFKAFSAIKSGEPLVFAWGDGSASTTGDSASHSYPTSGLYNLVVSSPDGWAGVTRLLIEAAQGTGYSPYCGQAVATPGKLPPYPSPMPSLGALVDLQWLQASDTWFTGTFPALPWGPNLQHLDMQGNAFNSYNPSAGIAASPNLNYCDLHFSGLSVLPSFANCPLLTYYEDHDNPISGTIWDVTQNPLLQHLRIAAADGNITGSPPVLSNCPQLSYLGLQNMYITGGIPDVTLCTALTYFSMQGCQYINSYSEGAFATQKNLATLDLQYMALPATAVNAILHDCVASLSVSGRVPCALTLNEYHNATPTGQGLLDKATLIAAGWTVTTN